MQNLFNKIDNNVQNPKQGKHLRFQYFTETLLRSLKLTKFLRTVNQLCPSPFPDLTTYIISYHKSPQASPTLLINTTHI